MTTKRVRLKVLGKVQGVFFRQSTKEQASLLQISGWVRNEADGGVLIEAQGSEEQLAKLIDWSRNGPPSAQVDKIEVEWLEIKTQENLFKIQRGDF